jgi:exopolyphosphatase/guanosine-5'-triphosphate,3'-diphosphate pyrophosphatase
VPAENAGPAEVLAAVDLGSNSFHMIVGELRHGQLAIIDRLRETVRLSEGLEEHGELTEAAKGRALECLARFGERLQDMRASNVRAAGTSTLRRAADSKAFCRLAEKALGHPIEIISGIEEARLIYSGVVHSTPPSDGFRLVMDIGGGSTELILGQGTQPRALESLHMGCVLMTERFFPAGAISHEAFTRARLAIRLKLRPVKAFFRDTADIEAIGASGTVRATEVVARELGIVDDTLTRGAVETLIARVIECGHVEELTLPGLSERRAQVWPGGLAILVELMSVLRIDKITTSDGALREGLLYDYIGRLQHEDARERSVRALAGRYSVDPEQAERVASTAAVLLAKCSSRWDLESDLAGKALEWSARLHEIGLDISHDGFQRHGAYIVGNADLPGFPRNEQDLLAFLIASQRRNIDASKSEALPSSWQKKALRLAILLRLAVLLNRSRSRNLLPEISLEVGKRSLGVRFPAGWLDENPLSVAELERERAYLREVGYRLEFA